MKQLAEAKDVLVSLQMDLHNEKTSVLRALPVNPVLMILRNFQGRNKTQRGQGVVSYHQLKRAGELA